MPRERPPRAFRRRRFSGAILEGVSKSNDGSTVLGIHHPHLRRGPLLGGAGGFRVGLLKRHPRHHASWRHPAATKGKRLLPSAKQEQEHERRRHAHADAGDDAGLGEPFEEFAQEAGGRVDD